MKNKEKLYSMQFLSLFAFFILLACTTYFVFPSYVAENSTILYLPFVIINFIVYGILLYFSLRNTMDVQWIMTIAVVISVLKPFFDYATLENNHFSLLLVALLLSFYFLFPYKKEETV